MTAIRLIDTTITDAIDRWHEEHAGEKPRPHLGASVLGHPCRRWLWLSFHWAVRETHPGRLLRLFRRGQAEEAVIARDLRNIGINITHTSADDGGQVYVDLGSHCGGSLDGIIEGGVPGAEKTRHVAEFKTHSAKSFAELVAKGVFEAKRRHWCQMQCYMYGTKINRALYVAVCKNDDSVYTERVEYDAKTAEVIIRRGHEIALAVNIPPPISTKPGWFQCKMCPAYDFCHVSRIIKPDRVNCRTCAHSTAMPDGSWKCERVPLFGLSPEDQLEGCEGHVIHPDLVPWEFFGGTDDRECATYEINGRRVVNGGRRGAIPTKALLSGGAAPPGREEDIPF